MKTSATILFLLMACRPFASNAQSIIGNWQLMKQTTCLESHLPDNDSTSDSEDLLQDMKSREDRTPQIISFKDKQNGEESTKILNTSKNSNVKHFLYKFDGSSLYILDKKSRTIAESYSVDTFQGDTLILSNSARPCETKVFARIK